MRLLDVDYDDEPIITHVNLVDESPASDRMIKEETMNDEAQFHFWCCVCTYCCVLLLSL